MNGFVLVVFQALELVGFVAVMAWTVREVRGAMREVRSVAEAVDTERTERRRDIAAVRMDIVSVRKDLTDLAEVVRTINLMLAAEGKGV